MLDRRELGGERGVALLAEGVDRNKLTHDGSAKTVVALLAEGVDRNNYAYDDKHAYGLSPSSRRAWIEILLLEYLTLCTEVALLAEGVDRNSVNNRLTSAAFCRPPRGGRG